MAEARAQALASTPNTIGSIVSLGEGARADHARDVGDLAGAGIDGKAKEFSSAKVIDVKPIDFTEAEHRQRKFEAERAQRELAERFGRITDGYAACGLPASYVRREKSLDSFVPQNKAQHEVRDRVREWVRHHYEQRPTAAGPAWLYIWGETPGVGKTHLAASALAEFIRLGGSGRFITLADLVLWARLDSQNAAEAVQACRKTQMLVLDDLGAEKMTEFSIAILGQILNARAEALRLTILTSNYSIATVANRFEISGEEIAAKRIASRIAGMTVGSGAGVFELVGKDMR